jgi:hypothetical protein
MPTDSYLWFFIARSPGEVRRNERSITCLIAKKVLDDTGPTEKRKQRSGDHSIAGTGIAEDC